MNYISYFVRIIYLGFLGVLKLVMIVVMIAHNKDRYDNEHNILVEFFCNILPKCLSKPSVVL